MHASAMAFNPEFLSCYVRGLRRRAEADGHGSRRYAEALHDGLKSHDDWAQHPLLSMLRDVFQAPWVVTEQEMQRLVAVACDYADTLVG